MEAREAVASVRDSSRRMVRELGFMEGQLAELGVSHSECHALIELERAGPATANELGERLNLDKSTASRLVKRLKERGLVLVGIDRSDERRKPARLSAAGKKKVEAIHRHANAQVEEALATLSAEDRAAVCRGLELYASALRRARAASACEIREIRREDDAAIAGIIRAVMPEFGCAGAGFALHDAEVAAMSAAYAGEGAGYFVIERDGEVLGGAGFGPLAGGDGTTCELRKMYFLPALRGRGLGARLLGHVLDAARAAGFTRCYLETTSRMHAARALYERFGFAPLAAPLGATGHFGCDAWYAKPL